MTKVKKQVLPNSKDYNIDINSKYLEKISKKFNIIIDKNNNPVIWIDDVVHFMTQQQYHAFVKQAIHIAITMNPEIDY